MLRSCSWLIEQLSTCWRAPSASPEIAAQYRGRQHQSIVRQIPLCSVANLLTIGLIYVSFRDLAAQGSWVRCIELNVVTQIFCVIYWWIHQGGGRNLVRGSGRAIFGVTAGIVISATLGALICADLFGLADERGRLWITAIVAAFIATGGWLFATVPYAGVTWAMTWSCVSAVVLVMRSWEAFGSLAGLLIFYGMTLSAGVLMTSRTFIRRLMAETELMHQRQLVGLLLNDFEENASDWLWETDRQGRLVHVSSRLAQAMAMQPEQLQNKALVDIVAATFGAPDASNEPDLLHLKKYLAQGSPFRDIVVAVMVHGEKRWWSLTAKPLVNKSDEIVGWRGVGSDITAMRQRDMELVRLANVDSLTGLANRHQFSEQLLTHFRNPQKIEPCTLFVLDLDNFKAVNDTLGHNAGDQLLSQVAKRLETLTKPRGLLARLGGDEFALIVPGRMADVDVHALAASLLACVAHPFMLNGHMMEVHASIGVGFAPDDAPSAEELLKVSDMALYEAKAAGRHTTRLFQPEMALQARRKLEMLSDMHEGMARGDFFVAYQPQIDMVSGEISGFEALMRWRHPVRGLISPAEFIPVAEDSGLIVPLGAWILSQACKDAMQWPASMSVSVNVSAIQFARSDLVDVVGEALRRSGLPTSRLELELTESTLMGNTAEISALLKVLRQSGVSIALDDFGTGYSSLSYLRNFPLDKLKIDQSFVRSLDNATDSSSLVIIQAINQIAQGLNLKVTAEGVETASQRKILSDMGCSFAQGFLFAKPMDAAQTLAYIERALAATREARPKAQAADAALWL